MSLSNTNANTNADAQVVVPSTIHITAPRSSLTQSTADPLDAFFGRASTTNSSRESRHDRRISEALPPYTESASPPNYQEPASLAMYLFKFGWLFPPFWILGACILASTLRAPTPTSNEQTWMPDKSPAEREEMIQRMRRVEVKWAKRCLYALIGFLMVVVLATVLAVMVKRA